MPIGNAKFSKLLKTLNANSNKGFISPDFPAAFGYKSTSIIK
jgi:hypothetical protein